jgi:hypothetical protein
VVTMLYILFVFVSQQSSAIVNCCTLDLVVFSCWAVVCSSGLCMVRASCLVVVCTSCLFVVCSSCVVLISVCVQADQGVCEGCHPSCKTCTGLEKRDCHTCPPGKELKLKRKIPKISINKIKVLSHFDLTL